MEAILAEFFLEQAAFIYHGRKIIEVHLVVHGPVFPARSFVPARIITTTGRSAITSARNRTSICGVVCPLIPRSIYGFPGKNPPKRGSAHISVMESPMKTTRSSSFVGAVKLALA